MPPSTGCPWGRDGRQHSRTRTLRGKEPRTRILGEPRRDTRNKILPDRTGHAATTEPYIRVVN